MVVVVVVVVVVGLVVATAVVVVVVVVAARGPAVDPPFKKNRNVRCLLKVLKVLARP